MSAVVDTSIDWQREVLRLKYGPQQLTASEIAEQVGKHAATVRKVVARATEDDVAEVLGGETFSGPIPGQTTVDDHLPPEDDPEHPDTLAEFRAEAGKAVGPMPPDPNPPEPLGVETRLAGTRQLALDFGENAALPGGATVTFKSAKLASGFYGLGDIFSGTFTARVTKTPGEEGFDKDAEDWRTKDVAYTATLTEVALAPAPYSRLAIDLEVAVSVLEDADLGAVAAILRRLTVS